MRYCACKDKERVIALLDVDAFEIQVRGKAAGISSHRLSSEPFAVLLTLITCVNQPAKNYGVVRGPSFQNWNPNNKIGVLKTPYKYGKAENLSLRKAGDDINDCIQYVLEEICTFQYCVVCGYKVQGPIIEKNGCDEFYLDLTDEVYQRMMCGTHINLDAFSNGDRNVKMELSNFTIEKYDFTNIFWKRFLRKNCKTENVNEVTALLLGAEIVVEVLDAIKNNPGFEVSGGVSTNKLLSKIACGMSKPKGLAVLASNSFSRIKKSTRFTKIPGLGGDKGAEISSTWSNIITISDFINAFNGCELWKYFNEHQEIRIWNALHGIDSTPVIEKKLDKITCGKSLNTYRGNIASTKQDFLDHLENRFHEMRDNLLYVYDRKNGGKPVSLKLEIFKHGPMRPQLVFREEIKFSWNMMMNLLLWKDDPLKFCNLQEWKPLFGKFKSLISENSSMPLFQHDGMYIRNVCKINFIAYF